MKNPVNWSLIEALMGLAIRGGQLSKEAHSELQRAHARHPAKYSELHKSVKKVEMDRMAMRDPK
jgi:hypothetical protein